VPYLARINQDEKLKGHLERFFPLGKSDLATSMLLRCFEMLEHQGSISGVFPQNWLFLKSYMAFRRTLLDTATFHFIAVLGPGAFGGVTGEVVKPCLTAFSARQPHSANRIFGLDTGSLPTPAAKAEALANEPLLISDQGTMSRNPDSRILLQPLSQGELLARVADCYQGTTTGDNSRWVRFFWEVFAEQWMRFQGTVSSTEAYGGRSSVLWWGDGGRSYAENPQARFQGQPAWGRHGVAISQMGSLAATLYTGEPFDMNTAAIIPRSDHVLPALWAFLTSPDFARAVRIIDPKVNVTTATLVKVPFDADHWSSVAKETEPLPDPWSGDPTQWLFEGRPEISTAPLQVAVGRLLGYRWPEQPEADDLDTFVDGDGIVCLPSVVGEAPAADRLRQLLAVAFDEAWAPPKARELLEQVQSKKKNLDDWLRDEFFKQHCALFGNRPFVWHVWDGQRDGFSALVNYHRLDRKALEKLTYTYLGQDWVERQRAEVRDGVAGADARLAAALGLQRKLEAILEGEAPLDIYVRWKELHEQPIGWEPDLNDGVRLNIRPFVEADVLRSPFNIHWQRDRGKNPDGTERLNDIHLTLAEKLEAHQKAGRM
jgi:hypothetical protein